MIQKKYNQSGDTLVEVLIAVAVISSVLVGAFIVSQQSVKAVRGGQERAEMTQILQGQVELVRSLALQQSDDTTGVYQTSPRYFCIDTRSGATYHQRVESPGLATLPMIAIDDFADYNPACKDLQGRYNVAIMHDSSSTPGLFRFYGRWDGISGNKSQVELVYRIHPGIVPGVSSLTMAVGLGADILMGKETTDKGDGDLDDPTGPCWVRKGWTDVTCWHARPTNNSPSLSGVLEKCEWDWGDGTFTRGTASDPVCQKGTEVFHPYNPVRTGPPKEPFTIKLTNTSTTGQTGVDIINIKRPY